jgi:hypothetical protein
MPFTNFPYGVTSFGIPLMGQNVGIPYGRGGSVWFVASPDVDQTFWANDSNAGTSPNEAFATINRAIDEAEPGDTIVIFSGSYDENVVVDKDYITIIGAQISGYGKPDIVPSSGLALYNQAAQGMVLRHLRLAAPAADVDLMLIEGNGYIVEDLVLDGDATMGNAKALIRLKGNDTDDSYTASEGVIRNCLFRGSGGDGLIFDTAEAAVGVGETDVTVENCVFVGIDQIAIATADTGPGTYSIQRGQIRGCLFEDKNKATYIDLTTSNGGAAGDQSGSCYGNYFASDTMTTTVIKAVGTAWTFIGNYDTVGIFDGSGLD